MKVKFELETGISEANSSRTMRSRPKLELPSFSYPLSLSSPVARATSPFLFLTVLYLRQS